MSATCLEKDTNGENVPRAKIFRPFLSAGVNNKRSAGFLPISFALLLFSRELQHGIPITDENDNRLGESTKAAQQAISQVVVSRILMASPGMGMNIFAS